MRTIHKHKNKVFLILDVPNNSSQLLFPTRKGSCPTGFTVFQTSDHINTIFFEFIYRTKFESSLLPKLVMPCNIHGFMDNSFLSQWEINNQYTVRHNLQPYPTTGIIKIRRQGLKIQNFIHSTHWKEGGLESPIPTVLGIGGCRSDAADITDC